jgi:hypothetical protein
MNTERRSLLKVVATSVGLGLVSVAGGQKVLGQSSVTEVKSCKVVAISGTIIYASDSKGQRLTLRLDNNSVIWKGRESRELSVLQPGDFFYATLEPGSPGVVRKLYANIVNHYGRIVGVQGNEFDLLIYKPGPTNSIVTVTVDRDTIIHNQRTSIAQADFMQVVGLELPNGKVKATRLFLYKD